MLNQEIYINEKELNSIDCFLFLTFVYKKYYLTRGYSVRVIFTKYITSQTLLENFNNRYLYILYLIYLNKTNKEITQLLQISSSRFHQIINNINKVLIHPRFQKQIFIRVYRIENNQRLY